MKRKTTEELVRERLDPACTFAPETIHQGLVTLEPMFDREVAECQRVAAMCRHSDAGWAVELRAEHEKTFELQVEMKAAIQEWRDDHPLTCPVCKDQYHHDSMIHCKGCHMLICRNCHRTYTQENGCRHSRCK